MEASPSRNATMDSPQGTDREWANEESSTVWPDTAAGRLGAKDRLARLVRALETDVIPRLVQAHRPVEILQSLLAQVTQLDPRRFLFLIVEQVTRRLRDEHLTAVRRIADPGGAMDSETVVAATALLRLPGVEIAPGSGLAHRRASLDALAVMK